MPVSPAGPLPRRTALRPRSPDARRTAARALAAALAVALHALALPAALAQSSSDVYDVMHEFTVTPFSVPTGPAIKFVSYNWSVIAEANRVSSLGQFGTVGSVAISPGDPQQFRTVSRASGGATATANSAARVFGPRASGAFDAYTRAWGSAFAPARTSAFAGSVAGLNFVLDRAFARGNITWDPSITEQVSGTAIANARLMDPIHFDIIDLDGGSLLGGDLLEIEADLAPDGALDWAGGTFSLDAIFFRLLIQLATPFTLQQGTVDFLVEGGVVTRSNATGIFAGLLPGVGSPGTFSVPFGPIVFDYDLGPVPEGGSIGMSMIGGSVVPEPATVTLVALGLAGVAALGRRRGRGRVAIALDPQPPRARGTGRT